MRVVQDLLHTDTEIAQRLVVTIGVFDGVHLGHQRVIEELVAYARELGEPVGQVPAVPAVVTFDPVPAQVLYPETFPGLLTETDYKLQLLEGLGIQLVFVLVFDRALAEMSPEPFVRGVLVEKLRAEGVVVGHDWRFGSGGAGDHNEITALGKRYGFGVRQTDPYLVDGRPVSSTLVRARILEGDLEGAGRLLGRRYALYGPVTRGSGLGRELGFRTANIDPESRIVPPDGIYAASVRFDTQELPAALYIGTSPTVKEQSERTVEVHILNYRDELYGRKIEVVILKRLRDERKFPDRDSLKGQIAEDIERTRQFMEDIRRVR
jgi:riboflavin kinase/FMN adenylyltransferase